MTLSSSTLTHEDVRAAHQRLDRIEAQQQERERHAARLLRIIEEAQQEAKHIIARSRQLESEVQ